MPVSYSGDLRWRVIWQFFLRRRSIREISRDLYLSKRSIVRYIRSYRHSGDVLPKKQSHHGPEPAMSEFELATLLEILHREPTTYLCELQEELRKTTGCSYHASTIYRALKRLGMSRKVVRRIALQRCTVKRALYLSEILEFDPKTLVFIDETGSTRRNAVRKYGYSLVGVTPVTHRLCVYGKRLSAIGIMTCQQIEDVYIVERNVNADMFLQFLQRCLLPILLPFDGDNPRSVVVLDNASIYHVDLVTHLISTTKALLKFLPPYSPDFNPFWEVFSKVKAWLL